MKHDDVDDDDYNDDDDVNAYEVKTCSRVVVTEYKQQW